MHIVIETASSKPVEIEVRVAYKDRGATEQVMVYRTDGNTHSFVMSPEHKGYNLYVRTFEDTVADYTLKVYT